jgi:hypothetical protein
MSVFKQKVYKKMLLQQDGATQLFHITIRAELLGSKSAQKWTERSGHFGKAFHLNIKHAIYISVNKNSILFCTTLAINLRQLPDTTAAAATLAFG